MNRRDPVVRLYMRGGVDFDLLHYVPNERSPLRGACPQNDFFELDDYPRYILGTEKLNL